MCIYTKKKILLAFWEELHWIIDHSGENRHLYYIEYSISLTPYVSTFIYFSFGVCL